MRYMQAVAFEDHGADGTSLGCSIKDVAALFGIGPSGSGGVAACSLSTFAFWDISSSWGEYAIPVSGGV